MIINLEEESKKICEETLEKISNYLIFANFMYSKEPYSAVICHEDPGKDVEYYEMSPSIIIKIHYIYIPQEDIWRKYENLIKKIKQKEKLTEDETLDIAFVPKFISKEYGQFVTESLAGLFKYALTSDKIPKRDIGVLLGAMILKHFDTDEKITELMEEIGMKQIENEIRILAREKYKDEYEKIEREKQELELENLNVKKEYNEVKRENNALKEGISKLKEIPDLNSSEAKKIINSLSLL